MSYDRQAKVVTDLFIRSSGGSEATLIIPPPKDPFTGRPLGEATSQPVYAVTAKYSREDIANPSLANGLLKVLIAPLYEGNPVPNLIDIVENKESKITLPNNKTYSIRYVTPTQPDAVTPLLVSIFVGA